MFAFTVSGFSKLVTFSKHQPSNTQRQVIEWNLEMYFICTLSSILGKGGTMSLIEEAKNKDPDAFDRLMQTQLQKMYRIAMTMLQNEEDAADAIQETVLKCWQKIGQVRNNDYFETWLVRILINQCKDILRSRRKVVYVDELPEIVHEDHYFTNEWKEILGSLNEKCRVVMELYYVDGFSTKEIAEMLHITDMNVRSRMTRGRKELRQLLSKSSAD